MRHILYLLLVANLVYLGWNLLQNDTGTMAETALPPLPASVKPLVTLQESRQKSSAVSGNETDSNALETVEPATVPSVDPGTHTTAESAGTDTSASELNALNSIQPPGAGQPGGYTCQALGPFELVDEVKTVAARLDALGLKVRQRTAEVSGADVYWIYLPSMSREAALEVTRKLADRGDTDYFIGKENYVSLGTYQDLARAEERLRRIRELGLDAVLSTRHNTHDAYWLEFEQKAGAEQEIAGILRDKPQLQLHALACL
jgi:hypothetical protein